MTKEELKQEAEEWIKDHSGLIGSYEFVKYDYDSMQKAYLAGAEPREKRIEELEKEVEMHKWNNIFLEDCAVYDKKIAEEYTTLQERIEQLEKENAELKADNDARKFAMAMSEKVEKQLREENAELKNQLEMSNKVYNDNLDYSHHIEEQLTKAKVALRNVIDYLGQFCSDYPDCVIKAEQFLNEVEK